MSQIPAVSLALLLAAPAIAGDVLVSRPPASPTAESDGVIAGESDRFGDFRGVYPADAFELDSPTTLGHIDVFGSNSAGGSTGFLYTGFTLTISQDVDGQPEGLPYDPSGEFGTTALLQLADVAEGAGLTYLADGDGVVNVRIDFEDAFGGPVMLEPGAYWISVVPRMPDTPVGDPSGRWNWKMSLQSPPTAPQWIDSNVGDWVTVASLPPNNRPGLSGVSMAWELVGTVAACAGDLDGSGDVNFTDLASVLSAWGPCDGCDGDIDGNGIVDFEDLTVVLGAWGPC